MEYVEPVLLSELGDYEPIVWFWDGYIAPSRKTIIIGDPKAGKTTLIAHVVKGFSGCTSSVGPSITPTKSLILTEEHEDLWKCRRDDLEIDGDEVWIKRIKRPPNCEEWRKMLLHEGEFCLRKGIQVVIVDTLSSLWPATDENNAVEVNLSLDPLNKLADLGIAVVCLHHAPKAKQVAILSARGSTAIGAFFDVVLNMRRSGRGGHSPKRTIKAWGRDRDVPEKMILDYRGRTGYASIMSDEEDDFAEELAVMALDQVLEFLNGEPQTYEQLRTGLRMGQARLKSLLDDGVKSGKIEQHGKGKRGDITTFTAANKTPVSPLSIRHKLD